MLGLIFRKFIPFLLNHQLKYGNCYESFINTLHFSNQHVEIYISEFFGDFWATFPKVSWSNLASKKIYFHRWCIIRTQVDSFTSTATCTSQNISPLLLVPFNSGSTWRKYYYIAVETVRPSHIRVYKIFSLVFIPKISKSDFYIHEYLKQCFSCYENFVQNPESKIFFSNWKFITREPLELRSWSKNCSIPRTFLS